MLKDLRPEYDNIKSNPPKKERTHALKAFYTRVVSAVETGYSGEGSAWGDTLPTHIGLARTPITPAAAKVRVSEIKMPY
jgi:hypothetical protein